MMAKMATILWFMGVGIQRNNGMEGFDWAIHKGDPVAADTDLTPQIPGLVEIPDAALAVILRDRFDSVEGVSGWKYDDYLRGSVRSIRSESLVRESAHTGWCRPDS